MRAYKINAFITSVSALAIRKTFTLPVCAIAYTRVILYVCVRVYIIDVVRVRDCWAIL